MKLLKFIPLLLLLTFFNSSANAAKDCDEIKGNIVGKLFCKVKSDGLSGLGSTSSVSETSNSTEEEESELEFPHSPFDFALQNNFPTMFPLISSQWESAKELEL